MRQKKPPKPKEPAPMPDEEELAKARRKRIGEIMDRSGRQSTILADAGQSVETLG